MVILVQDLSIDRLKILKVFGSQTVSLCLVTPFSRSLARSQTLFRKRTPLPLRFFFDLFTLALSKEQKNVKELDLSIMAQRSPRY